MHLRPFTIISQFSTRYIRYIFFVYTLWQIK